VLEKRQRALAQLFKPQISIEIVVINIKEKSVKKLGEEIYEIRNRKKFRNYI